MITGHKIINQNNQNVLFLYLDFNYEFSKIGENKSFFKTIKDYIKKINFKDTKIILVASGIIIGTLLISPQNLNNGIVKNNYDYVNKIIIHDNYNEQLIDYEIDVSKDIIETNNEKKVNETQTKVIKKNEEIINKIDKVIEKDNNTYVTINRSNGTILNIELEQYIIGVVSAEMPASFNIEALKAQAIVARTYAMKNINKLTDTVSTQVYKDNNELKNMWGNDFDKYYSKIKKAVNDTKGITIKYNNKYIDAVYHSTSNGYTEDSINVWGNYIPYLKSVESNWDKNVSSYKREKEFSLEEFYTALKLDIDEPLTYDIIHNNSSRVSTIIINNKTFTGIEFRKLFNLRSTDFEINIKDKIIITTYGYGHGVGMSQYGANEMAKQGFNYIDIIKHYYSGVTIS